MIVIDASVIATALGDDGPDGRVARDRLRGETLVAPALLDGEVLAVWGRQVAAGEMDEARAAAARDDLAALALVRVDERPLAARCRRLVPVLTASEARYVALADALGIPLVTADESTVDKGGVLGPVEIMGPTGARVVWVGGRLGLGVSPRLQPSAETSVVDWLVSSLHPFRRATAGSLVPPIFEAYARILYPARGAGDRVVRWSEVAAWSGRVYHPRMQFEALATPAPGGGQGPKPWDGHTPWPRSVAEMPALARVLRGHTTTPDRVWYCVWEGYGDVVPQSTARVRREARDYLLYSGALAALDGGRTPDCWFPEDRAWCVAGDVDLCWCYVGGSRACVDALLACPDLESVPAEPDDRLSYDSDGINLLTPQEWAAWNLPPSGTV